MIVLFIYSVYAYNSYVVYSYHTTDSLMTAITILSVYLCTTKAVCSPQYWTVIDSKMGCPICGALISATRNQT